MADRNTLWKWLADVLTAGQPVALLVVVDSVGSSPGKVGAKMAMTVDGSLGTIGGGAIESALMKIARGLLDTPDAQPQLHRRVHRLAAGEQASGMICGGEQTVLIYPCRSEDQATFEQCLEFSRRHTPLDLCISASGLCVMPRTIAGSVVAFDEGKPWLYRETLGPRYRAFIIGGGHVSLALSKLLNWLDFDITVMDERETVETMRLNEYARQKWTIPYVDIAEYVPEGPDVFVFIMTHSPDRDQLVVARLLGKRFAYLGLLGSGSKIAALKAALAAHLSNEQLSQLHAPMGLAIASHTPEEIAISIAAELIQLINAG